MLNLLRGTLLYRNHLTSSASWATTNPIHEKSNTNLQVHGGAVRLYGNPEAFTLFMIAGPDCGRCVKDFEAVLDSVIPSTTHHEEARSFQIKYKKDVLSFVKIAEQLGNPFDNNHELVALHTQQVMEDNVVASLTQLPKIFMLIS